MYQPVDNMTSDRRQQQSHRSESIEKLFTMTPAEEEAFRDCCQSRSVLAPLAISSMWGVFLFKALTLMKVDKGKSRALAISTGLFAYLVQRMDQSVACLEQVAPRLTRQKSQPQAWYAKEHLTSKTNDSEGLVASGVYKDENTINYEGTVVEDMTLAPMVEQNEQINAKEKITYDDLRKRNRDEYMQRRFPRLKVKVPQSGNQSELTTEPEPEAVFESDPTELLSPTQKFKAQRRNKYGDLME